MFNPKKESFYFIDDQKITVYTAEGAIHTWPCTHPLYDTVANACKNADWITVATLSNEGKYIIESDSLVVEASGCITIRKNNMTITLNPEETDSSLVKMIKLLQDRDILKDNIEKVKPFLINMLENPYIEAKHEIYEYCCNHDFEITDDGCFLAYKNVRSDLGSVYDNGATKHVIGEYTKVEVFDTDRTRNCSTGLHFCAKRYLKSYPGEKTIVVKVNPKHVVSIPLDHNFAKGRCSEYLTVCTMAKDSSLDTFNIKEATGETIVETEERAKAKKKYARHQAKAGYRILETAQWMQEFNNDAYKVSSVMGISPQTVKRNMRKYRAKGYKV